MIKTSGLLAAAGKYQESLSVGIPSEVWNPQVLGTSVVRGLWNPFGNSGSVTEAAGAVSQVDDLSGNGFDLASSGADPNWNAGTIEIDHTNSESLITTMDAEPSVGLGSIFVYAELGTGNPFGRWIGRPGENDANQTDYLTPFLQSGAGPNLTMYKENVSILSTPKPTGFNLLEARIEAANISYWQDGQELVTAAATAPAINFEQFGIGRGNTSSQSASINFRVAAIVEGILSTDDRQRLEAWMMQQVGDQASLPISHPYRNTLFIDPV